MNKNSENNSYSFSINAILPDGKGGFTVCPNLMTEDELIRFLRIPELSKSKDFHNTIENLKRMHDLPRVHISGKTLFPLEAINKWLQNRVIS